MVSFDGVYFYGEDQREEVMFLLNKNLGFLKSRYLGEDPDHETDPKIHKWIRVAPKELTGW